MQGAHNAYYLSPTLSNPIMIDRIVRSCKFCNNLLPNNYTSRKKVVYCSNKCQSKYRRKESIDINMKLFNEGKITSPHMLRKIINYIREHRCTICKRKTWNKKPIPLWVYHADGNPFNNLLSNLRLVCPNCDAQQETFGAKNWGKGRVLGKPK